ncbi:MAG TPA: DUF3313 family protein [Gammaproteobacteria bacterium]
MYTQGILRLFRFGPEAIWFGAGVLMLSLTGNSAVFAQEDKDDTFVGLQRVESSSLDELYVKPDVNFARYDKITIGNIPVSFNPYWRRDHRQNLTDSDVERIQETMARLLREQFVEEFTEEGGYKLVEAEEADETTLLFSPSIVRLNLYAPDTSAPGIRESFVTSAGHATLSLDVYDAVSGELLMHVQDYRFTKGFGDRIFIRATRASNAFQMRRLMSIWADRVHDRIVDLGGKT